MLCGTVPILYTATAVSENLMHILATFFALLLSFGHASSVRKALAAPQPATTTSAIEFTSRTAFLPMQTAAFGRAHIAR